MYIKCSDIFVILQTEKFEQSLQEVTHQLKIVLVRAFYFFLYFHQLTVMTSYLQFQHKNKANKEAHIGRM